MSFTVFNLNSSTELIFLYLINIQNSGNCRKATNGPVPSFAAEDNDKRSFQTLKTFVSLM